MRRLTKYVLNTFIVSYLAVIYFSGVPESNTLNVRIKAKATKIAFAVGIWPSWSMFAPNPIKFDSKTYVEITHKNGKVAVYDVEKDTPGILGPFRKARWMKYSQDNLRSPTQRALLNPAIRYFTRKYDSPENPIVNVQIRRKWSDIHPFSEVSLHSITSTPRIEFNEVLISQKLER
ncbi:MAG: hypothetical protein H0X46_10605 [Bacteroidetes bacterium]|nr:hypothetical protein [Bacteroidota bacterium]